MKNLYLDNSIHDQIQKGLKVDITLASFVYTVSYPSDDAAEEFLSGNKAAAKTLEKAASDGFKDYVKGMTTALNKLADEVGKGKKVDGASLVAAAEAGKVSVEAALEKAWKGLVKKNKSLEKCTFDPSVLIPTSGEIDNLVFKPYRVMMQGDGAEAKDFESAMKPLLELRELGGSLDSQVLRPYKQVEAAVEKVRATVDAIRKQGAAALPQNLKALKGCADVYTRLADKLGDVVEQVNSVAGEVAKAEKLAEKLVKLAPAHEKEYAKSVAKGVAALGNSGISSIHGDLVTSRQDLNARQAILAEAAEGKASAFEMLNQVDGYLTVKSADLQKVVVKFISTTRTMFSR